MSLCPMLDNLDRLAYGELPEGEALELRNHLTTCGACRREVESMRSERALMMARARSRHVPTARLLAAVQARRPAAVRHRPPVRATRWFPLAVGALCVALVAGVMSVPTPDPMSPDDLAEALMSIDHPAVEIARLESELSACLVATPDLGRPCQDLCL